MASYFSSSIGRKLLMALTGLFLITFLFVHLVGNLQLLRDDNGVAFNTYAHFMGSNPLIKFISIGNFALILVHIVIGITLYFKNKSARGSKGYKISTKDSKSTWQSRNMTLFGVILLVFIVMHLAGFWFRAKFGSIPLDETLQIPDLYMVVMEAFKKEFIVVIYVVSMLVLAFHLSHGFQSAFQTLGLNHKRYTCYIKKIGIIYSWVVSIGYALIPIIIYIKQYGK